MISLDSSLINREEGYDQIRDYLKDHQFTLGGNWEYDHGYFDRALDEENKVWLRIPFTVTHGVLDGNTDATNAIISIGRPFVLKHLYNEGLDKEAQVSTYGALVDQFQEPVDKDASLEDRWVSKAKDVLREVESSIPLT
ncbi:YugN-like family protein [Paenibacillus konkukensis]|uniref:YugN-like family protein n=1 Tax=Paenibacillus konkukensis TaxID=2020716 RepID=A0ABY4RWF7_9BACL|nr:YugN-like family protein [Paenibacillus konkukensis]UQZ86021.1 YugN-like family protein [Paenibacillus konkukensis]